MNELVKGRSRIIDRNQDCVGLNGPRGRKGERERYDRNEKRGLALMESPPCVNKLPEAFVASVPEEEGRANSDFELSFCVRLRDS